MGTDESLAETVSRVVDDAKDVARAEIALLKVQASAAVSEKIAGYRTAIVLFVVAGVLGLAALIGLIVGLILTLIPLVGPGFATLIVIGVTVLLAGLLGWIGARKAAAA